MGEDGRGQGLQWGRVCEDAEILPERVWSDPPPVMLQWGRVCEDAEMTIPALLLRTLCDLLQWGRVCEDAEMNLVNHLAAIHHHASMGPRL